MRYPHYLLLTLLSLNVASAWACSDGCMGAPVCNGLDGLPFLAPENDSRVNLALLLEEKGKVCLDRGKPDDTGGFPVPRSDTGFDDFSGPARCRTLSAGSAAFTAQLNQAALPSDDKAALAAARAQIDAECGSAPTLDLGKFAGKGQATRDYALYLQASNAFYAGQFDQADQAYGTLTRAAEPWLKETAQYMLARVAINQAQVGVEGKWGEFDVSKTNKPLLQKAEGRLRAYLKAYPRGLYAASAAGLQRRVYWLMGDNEKLASDYEKQLAAIDGANAHNLIDEIDAKLGTGFYPQAAPSLYMTNRLVALRDHPDGSTASTNATPTTPDTLPANFNSDWAAYLQLADHYYTQHDYAGVINNTQESTASGPLSPTAFSTQVLRGLAFCAQKNWPEAEKHWQKLLGSETDPVRQRYLQTALAVTQEAANQFDTLFASTPATTTLANARLALVSVAPSTKLRQLIQNPQQPLEERFSAADNLLTKDLFSADYTAYLSDNQLAAQALANAAPKTNEQADGSQWKIKDGVFAVNTTPQTDEATPANYCADFSTTVKNLEKNSHDAHNLVCFGNQLYGLSESTHADIYTGWGTQPMFGSDADWAKTTGDRFNRRRKSRMDYFRQVIADQSAPDNDRAYALYSAINCYTSSGINYCGGDDIPQAERKRWFSLLKRKYAKTDWAQAQKYYW